MSFYCYTTPRDLNEELETGMEYKRKRALKKKNTLIVGHLPLGKYGNLILYFLRADQDAKGKVVITLKKCNLGDRDGDGMQIP